MLGYGEQLESVHISDAKEWLGAIRGAVLVVSRTYSPHTILSSRVAQMSSLFVQDLAHIFRISFQNKLKYS